MAIDRELLTMVGFVVSKGEPVGTCFIVPRTQ